MIAELAYHKTPLGELTLRRRPEPLLRGKEVFEVKLGDEYLMSSLFTESEVQLAHLGLAELEGNLEVVVGGLGLGYTTAAALENVQVHRLLVVDLFQEVIEWHCNGLVPLGNIITGDPRCELRQGDFFKLAHSGFDEHDNGRKFDAVLLDIDHSPEFLLDEKNHSFYSIDGFSAIATQLNKGGSFALWSNDGVNKRVLGMMETVFGAADSHTIEFSNPYNSSVSSNTVYVARKLSR